MWFMRPVLAFLETQVKARLAARCVMREQLEAEYGLPRTGASGDYDRRAFRNAFLANNASRPGTPVEM